MLQAVWDIVRFYYLWPAPAVIPVIVSVAGFFFFKNDINTPKGKVGLAALALLTAALLPLVATLCLLFFSTIFAFLLADWVLIAPIRKRREQDRARERGELEEEDLKREAEEAVLGLIGHLRSQGLGSTSDSDGE